MGKSKQTTVFSLSNGEKVVFDQTAFQYVVNLKAKEIDRKSGKSRGGQVEVFRKLAQGLEPYNEKPTEAAISKIKNWYYDNNGPSDIDDIRKIATILDCKDNTFLKDYSEVNTMNTVNDTVNLNINQTDVIQALKKIKIQEIAHELYSKFIDLIGTYMKTELEIWVNLSPDTPEWKDAIKRLPDRFPVTCAIAKASMYLSHETIMNAYNLLEEMYGPQWNDWDETNQFESLDEFVGQRYRMYERHLEEKGLDKEDRELFDRNNDEWIQFSIDLNRDWWYKLDKAFVEYFEYDSGLYNFLTTNNLINE